MPAMTADQAASTLPGRRQKWQVAPMPAVMKQVAEQNQIFIHNVGPRMWTRQSSMGTFVIPACPAGSEYATARPIPGIISETVPVDKDKLERITFDGFEVAKDIVGTGAFRDSLGPFSDNLTRFGVFISRNEVPTEEELAAGKQAWHDECARLVQEADRAYEVNGGMETVNGYTSSNISRQHVDALKVLNWDRKWARKENQALVSCPNCAQSIAPAAAMCQHCDAVIDEEKARKLFPHRFASRGGRPKNEKNDEAVA